MQSSLDAALIDVQTGTEQINIPVTLNSNTTLNTATSTTLNFSNSIAGVGTDARRRRNLQPSADQRLPGRNHPGRWHPGELFIERHVRLQPNVTFNGGILQYAPSTTTDLTASGLNISVLAGSRNRHQRQQRHLLQRLRPRQRRHSPSSAQEPSPSPPLTPIRRRRPRGGTLPAGIAGAIPSITAMTVNSGATLDLNGFSQAVGSLSGAGNVIGTGNFTVGSNNTSTTFTGNLSNVGSLTKVGNGTLTLSGTDTYAGGTTINGGLLTFSNAGATPTTGSILVDGAAHCAASGQFSTVTGWLGSGKIDPTSTGTIIPANSAEAIDMNTAPGYPNLMLGHSGTFTYTGTLTPVSNIYRLGGSTGTLVLNTANALTGTGRGLVIAPRLRGNRRLRRRQQLRRRNHRQRQHPQLHRPQQLRRRHQPHPQRRRPPPRHRKHRRHLLPHCHRRSERRDNNTNSNNVTYAGSMETAAPPPCTTRPAPAPSSSAATNTYSGGTNVTGGTLRFATLSNLGTGGSLSISNGSTLQYATGTAPTSSLAVTIGTGGATIDTNSNDVTYASGIGNGGAGALTKAGAGTLTLGGTNTYTGGTNVNAGFLKFNSGVPATGLVTINAAGAQSGGQFPTVTGAQQQQDLHRLRRRNRPHRRQL